MNNVLIQHYQNGVCQKELEMHNVWTSYGKEYLSKLVALQAIASGGDVPQETHRIRYLGLGIGGKNAAGPAYGAAFLAAYPPGHDPNATAGNAYDRTSPLAPYIGSLERPIRVTGGTTPYPGAPTDSWLLGPPNISTCYRDINSVTFEITVDCTGGQFVYGPIPFAPVSEAGLFHSGASVHAPYGVPVAYVNFATIILTNASVVRFSWTVRLAS